MRAISPAAPGILRACRHSSTQHGGAQHYGTVCRGVYAAHLKAHTLRARVGLLRLFLKRIWGSPCWLMRPAVWMLCPWLLQCCGEPAEAAHNQGTQHNP